MSTWLKALTVHLLPGIRNIHNISESQRKNVLTRWLSLQAVELKAVEQNFSRCTLVGGLMEIAGLLSLPGQSHVQVPLTTCNPLIEDADAPNFKQPNNPASGSADLYMKQSWKNKKQLKERLKRWTSLQRVGQ